MSIDSPWREEPLTLPPSVTDAATATVLSHVGYDPTVLAMLGLA